MTENNTPENTTEEAAPSDIADGVMLVHLFKRDQKVLYKMNTFDRLNNNQPLSLEDLNGIGKMLADVTRDMESKKVKIITP